MLRNVDSFIDRSLANQPPHVTHILSFRCSLLFEQLVCPVYISYEVEDTCTHDHRVCGQQQLPP